MPTEDVALTNSRAPDMLNQDMTNQDITNQDTVNQDTVNHAGWYPDPADPRGLRYWDGTGWTEHRARLSTPTNVSANAPSAVAAICACGVVATGSCRVCSLPFCRAHISDQPRDDRPYLKRWDAWMCGGCIETGRRRLRAEQLARCESVAPRLAALPKIRKVRTFTGLRPRRTNLFSPSRGLARPVRAARGYLIEYDSGEENSTYTGLAMSGDGTTIYDVGSPVIGTASARRGPKLGHSGYSLRSTISIERLRDACDAPTNNTWFEHAARAYLRGAHRLEIEPDLSQPMERPDQSILDAIAADDGPPRPDEIVVELEDTEDITFVAIDQTLQGDGNLGTATSSDSVTEGDVQVVEISHDSVDVSGEFDRTSSTGTT